MEGVGNESASQNRRTRGNSVTFHETPLIVASDSLRSNQWIPFSVHMKETGALSIVSRGRYHLASQRQPELETWYAPKTYEHISTQAQ